MGSMVVLAAAIRDAALVNSSVSALSICRQPCRMHYCSRRNPDQSGSHPSDRFALQP
jgi:hypothetical protein